MNLTSQSPNFFRRFHIQKKEGVMDKGDEKKFSDSKICAVCGDSALGNNFNAVTCESCKAFFRRNALKTKVLRCPFNDNCQITLVTRRFCQRCRLNKCYGVGMKRELIMSEEEKQSKRRKVLANKAKFRVAPAGSPTQETTSSLESDSSDRILKSTTAEAAVQTEPGACWCPNSIQNRINSISSNGYYTSPPVSPQSYIHHVANSPGFPGSFTSMDATQKKLLSELLLASRALEAPVDQEVDLPGEEFKDAPKSLIDVINLTALAIRRLIKMCKKMNGFKLLCQEDQVSLLKQGCTQMMLLKSVSQFDPAKDSWKIPHTDQSKLIQVDVLKEARGNIYEAHETFVRTFDPRAARDANVMCILSAIALFDPSKQQLLDRSTVIRHQDMYYNLLQRYLDSTYPAKESLEIYQHLVMKMVELRHINEDHVKVYLDVNPSQVEPILIELFDLKPH